MRFNNSLLMGFWNAPNKTCVNLSLLLWICVQLHLVHWNEELYSSFAEAAKAADGLAVLCVFIKVCFVFKLIISKR
jgi:hypothetical protein